MNKRAESNQGSDAIGVSPNFLIGLVIAAIIIIGLATPLIIKPIKMLMTDPEEQITKQNFEKLNSEIEQILNGKKKYSEFPFVLGEDGYVIGFHRDWNPEIHRNVCKYSFTAIGEYKHKIKVSKPDNCDRSCLCLTKKGFKDPECFEYDIDYFVSIPFKSTGNVFGTEDDKFDNIKNMFSGSAFEEIDKFNHDSDEYAFSNLYIFGHCGYPMKPVMLYVDSFELEHNGRMKKAIFISPKNDYTEQRKRLLYG